MNEQNPSAAPQAAVEPKRPALALILYWFRDLAVSVVLAALVILFLYQPVKVEGTSMMPALVDQDRIFINKFIYRLGMGTVERGDMVVFHYPSDPAKSYIKRVIGVPGDRVELREGAVLVNGAAVHEPYVPEGYRDSSNMPPLTVPPEHFFVLGDHRSSSNDSRNWGPVHRRYIYGKAVFVYWPIEKLGVLH